MPITIGRNKKLYYFPSATILRSRSLLIYLSLNIRRHYHNQTELPNFKQEKTKKQEELQGKFQALTRWDMNLWLSVQETKLYEKKLQAQVIEWIKTSQAKKKKLLFLWLQKRIVKAGGEEGSSPSSCKQTMNRFLTWKLHKLRNNKWKNYILQKKLKQGKSI